MDALGCFNTGISVLARNFPRKCCIGRHHHGAECTCLIQELVFFVTSLPEIFQNRILACLFLKNKFMEGDSLNIQKEESAWCLTFDVAFMSLLVQEILHFCL
jgi:hypothetical protein